MSKHDPAAALQGRFARFGCMHCCSKTKQWVTGAVMILAQIQHEAAHLHGFAPLSARIPLLGPCGRLHTCGDHLLASDLLAFRCGKRRG